MAMLGSIYGQPLERIVLWIFLLVAVWAAAGCFWRVKRWWQLENGVLTLVSIYGILYFTVLRRGTASIEPAILVPFHSFIAAQIQPEIYREMLMNVFLFVPFGLSLPNALSAINSKKLFPVKTTVIAAFLLSAGIELCQYIFHMGRCEVDDVLFNTLGTWIGTIAYHIACRDR